MSLMTIREVATILKSSETTVRRLIRTRQIPFRQMSRRYFFTNEDITDYINRIRVDGTSEAAQ